MDRITGIDSRDRDGAKRAPPTERELPHVEFRKAATTDPRGHCGILLNMAAYPFTEYFENEVLRKRPYLKKEWCIRVVEEPVRSEPQEHNRYRFWAAFPELGGRYLRIITLEDRVTIHNAFPDRGFKP